MKRTISFAIIGFTLLTAGNNMANAQSPFGVEFGYNIHNSNVAGGGFKGFSVGPTVRGKLSDRWFVESALKLSMQPVRIETKWGNVIPTNSNSSGLLFVNNGNHDKLSLNPFYLTLPVRLGFRVPFSQNVGMSLAAGPMIGYGIAGGGSYESYMAENAGTPHLKVKEMTNNVFEKNGNLSIASSRFEYGITFKASLEMFRNWSVGFDYNVLGLNGDDSSTGVGKNLINGYVITSLNVGYRF